MLAETQSVAQIVWTRYALSLPIFLATVAPARWKQLFRTSRPGLQVARALMPLTISITMVIAVHTMPLAEATVILYAGPFLVVALSAPLLGERVNAASWIGVAVGFAAVLIVARPGFAGVSLYAVFPFIAAIFYAFLQLLTRRLATAGEAAETTLVWTLAIGAVLATPAAALAWEPLSASAWLLMLTLGVVFGLSQALMIRAFLYAPAGLLTPFSYAQVVAAAIMGMAAFGDVPDGWTWLGMAMIIAAGAYVMRRDTREDAQARPRSAGE
jgi:drug/metabolite transporter (DMT)-like permease